MPPTERIEFGDFQTPAHLARRVCDVLRDRGVKPAVIIEPTCGIGNFLLAAAEAFAACNRVIGVEVNPAHHATVERRIAVSAAKDRAEAIRADFFDFDWSALRSREAGPPLVVGNPPWVTVAGLGVINGTNAPRRQNIDRLSGIDAKTGKSNFDIAEWIVLHLMRAFEGSEGTIALLIKTSVARRVLAHAWRAGLPIGEPTLYLIDAKASFDVNVEAGLFVFALPRRTTDPVCRVVELSAPDRLVGSIGWRASSLVADVSAFDETADLVAQKKPPPVLRWRSGIKHDCSGALELTRIGSRFANGVGETVDVEPHVLYPMWKGSDVANGGAARRDLWMLVPQISTGTDTNTLARTAPLAWRYLDANREALDARKSSIYRGRPPFAIFGIGPYTFQNWKIATCGLYKKLQFALVGPREGRPVVFDDTCYHLSFDSQEAADVVLQCLRSDVAKQFFSARTFADAKRPITASLLNELDLYSLAARLGVDIDKVHAPTFCQGSDNGLRQPSLFAR